MSQVLKVGLIGCGVMGQSLADGLKDIPNAKLVAVQDPMAEAAQAAGAKYGVPSFTDLAEMLRQPELGGVIVATPPFTHRPVAEQAARAGKHIFLEKPMAAKVSDCDAILAAVAQAKVKLMIGHVCRFHGMHGRVRQQILAGAIGRPVFMQVYRIGGGWGGIWAKNWRASREQSGGTLMEVNAHEIDFMRYCLGEVATVYAAGGTYKQTQADFPDLAVVTLTFKNGAVGLLHSSQVSAIGGYGGRVDGTEGSLHFPAIWGDGAGLHHKTWEGQPSFIPSADIKVPSPVRSELAAWVNAVETNTEPPISGLDGRAAVQIAEAAYDSITSGKPVAL